MMLSVIIPVLNEEKHLKATLNQLYRFITPEIEILVVDGGSVDNTCDIAHLSGARLLHSPVKSRSAQMNLGAWEAQGDWFFLSMPIPWSPTITPS